MTSSRGHPGSTRADLRSTRIQRTSQGNRFASPRHLSAAGSAPSSHAQANPFVNFPQLYSPISFSLYSYPRISSQVLPGPVVDAFLPRPPLLLPPHSPNNIMVRLMPQRLSSHLSTRSNASTPGQSRSTSPMRSPDVRPLTLKVSVLRVRRAFA